MRFDQIEFRGGQPPRFDEDFYWYLYLANVMHHAGEPESGKAYGLKSHFLSKGNGEISNTPFVACRVWVTLFQSGSQGTDRIFEYLMEYLAFAPAFDAEAYVLRQYVEYEDLTFPEGILLR